MDVSFSSRESPDSGLRWVDDVGWDTISRILVPMDDSDHAGHTLAYAIDNHPDAEITVLHVVGVPSMMMGVATSLVFEDDLGAAAAERAQSVFERAHAIVDDSWSSNHDNRRYQPSDRNNLDRVEEYDVIILGAMVRTGDVRPTDVSSGISQKPGPNAHRSPLPLYGEPPVAGGTRASVESLRLVRDFPSRRH